MRGQRLRHCGETLLLMQAVVGGVAQCTDIASSEGGHQIGRVANIEYRIGHRHRCAERRATVIGASAERRHPHHNRWVTPKGNANRADSGCGDHPTKHRWRGVVSVALKRSCMSQNLVSVGEHRLTVGAIALGAGKHYAAHSNRCAIPEAAPHRDRRSNPQFAFAAQPPKCDRREMMLVGMVGALGNIGDRSH